MNQSLRATTVSRELTGRGGRKRRPRWRTPKSPLSRCILPAMGWTVRARRGLTDLATSRRILLLICCRCSNMKKFRQSIVVMGLEPELRFLDLGSGEAHGYKTEWLEESGGEEAGLKSATVAVHGSDAYGWLKTESGVHR